MSLEIAIGAAGGLALFLLAMAMMTGGLKTFAGAGLKRALERWTATPARGLLTGALRASAVAQRLSVEAADALLDGLSGTRRLVEQLVKADRMLRTPSHAPEIEAEPGEGAP